MSNSQLPATPLPFAERRLAIFETIFRQNGDAIVILDQGGFLDCNDAALAMFGYPDKAEFLRLHPRDLSPEFQPDGRQSFAASESAMNQAFQGGNILLEWQHIKRDGSPFPVEVMLIGTELDTSPTLIVLLRDISARKEAERRIAEQQAALHQSEKLGALGSLLAGVAHELNNPLAVVLGQAALMAETAVDQATAARAEKIRVSADRCARIIKSFLAIARQKPLEHEPVGLEAVIRSAIELTSYGLRSDGVDVNLAIEPGLPSVIGDKDQLGQVIMNLIVNADYALQAKQDARRLTVGAAREGKGYVRITVADNGPGVPSALRSRIFEPFFTTKPAGSGTGVGLSLCHGIISAHDGTLGLEDTPGGGATFVVRLPVAEAAASDSVGEESRPPKQSGARVLIVEDEADIADMIADIVEPLAGLVEKAANGAEGLRLLNRGSYDLVISDLRMPDIDGAAFYRMAREAGRDEQFLFVTGDSLSAHLSKFLSASSVPTIEKPFAPSELRATVARLLNKGG